VILTFDPAVRLVSAVVKNVFHAVVDAVSGILYPAVTVGVYVSVEPDPVIVSPSPVAVPVAKVYEVAERPLIVVVAKYPLSTLPDHVRLVPAEMRDDGVLKKEDQSVDEAESGTA
jgi:hypothetical protein